MRHSQSEQGIPSLNFLIKNKSTVRSSLSLESLPSTSTIIMELAVSMEYHIPFVVWPTLFLRLSSSKEVPKRAFKRVDLPELWEPIMESTWYALFIWVICLLLRPSSSSILIKRREILEDWFVVDELVLLLDRHGLEKLYKYQGKYSEKKEMCGSQFWTVSHF